MELAKPVVLVADDDPDIRFLFRIVLESDGYHVVDAADGAEAIALARQTLRPDVIVLDLSMPIMSGWEFLDARTGDPWLAAIPVVVLSGMASGVEGPWNAVVAKPFSLGELVAAIERCRGAAPTRGARSELQGR